MSVKPVVAVLCVLLGLACSRDAAEDRAVIAAVDELRDSAAADPSARRALIEKLEKLPASTPLARSARDECVKAYRALVDGKEAMAKFKHALEDPKASAKDLGDLAGTEDLIKRSEEAMPACNKAAVDLSLSRR